MLRLKQSLFTVVPLLGHTRLVTRWAQRHRAIAFKIGGTVLTLYPPVRDALANKGGTTLWCRE